MYPTTGFTPSQSETASRAWRNAMENYFRFRQFIGQEIQTEAEADKLRRLIDICDSDAAHDIYAQLPDIESQRIAEWLEPDTIGQAVAVTYVDLFRAE